MLTSFRRRAVHLFILPLALWIAGTAFAQAPYLAKGNQEANVFGGLSYGLSHWRGSVGGNYAVAPFNKYIMLYGEYSYFPGITRQIPDAPELNVRGGPTTVNFNDFHGGVHIRLPIFPEKRIVPYLSGGLGVLKSSGDASLDVSNGKTFVRTPFAVSSSSFAFNGGGGLRLYLSGDGRFGARFEAKAYRPTSDLSVPFGSHNVVSSAAVFGKISIGLFYQFH